MICQIAFKLAGHPLVAILGDDFRWSCPHADAMAAYLNVAFAVLDVGPADGSPGMKQAHAVAEYLKGNLLVVETEPDPVGVDF